MSRKVLTRRHQAEEAQSVIGVSNGKSFTASEVDTGNVGSPSGSATTVTTVTFMRFKLMSAKIQSATATAERGRHINGDVEEEMQLTLQKVNQYIAEATTLGIRSKTNVIQFWNDRAASYGELTQEVCQLITAPSSQAYVDRIFLVSGMLTYGSRNRMTKSLAGRVFLRLNKWVLDHKQ